MQTLPERSLSATLKNRSLFLSIEDVKTPFSSILEYLLRRLSRETRKFVNLILALSTPLRPSLCPRSSNQTPGRRFFWSSLIRTKNV